MDKLRDFIKSWPGRILLLLCLAPMVFLGLEGYLGQGRLTASQIAKVGQTPIELADVQAEANDMRVRLLAHLDAGMIDEKALISQTLDNIIHRTLLQEQGAALGMQVSDAAITAMLQSDPMFADANGQFSNEVFAAYLQQRGLTRDRLFAQQRTQLNLRTLMNGILSTAIYTNPEIARLIGLQTEARTLWVKRLSWQDYANQVSISEADIDAYYQQHKADLVRPAMVDLNYLVLSPADVAVSVSDDELALAYQAYLQEKNLGQKELAQILLTGDNASTRAADIHRQLMAGGDFVSLAKQHSDDPSGQSGGNIGEYQPKVFGSYAAAVDTALAKLEVGQISTPVQTAFGVHIFKVVNKAAAPSLESLKPTLTETVRNQKQQAKFNDQIFTINNLVADGFNLKDISNQLQLPLQRIDGYQNKDQKIMGQPAIMRAAFDEVLIQDKAVSANIDMMGATLWLEPSNYRPEQPLTRETATQTIKQRLTIQKASELALADAKAQAAAIDPNRLEGLTAVGQVTRQSEMLNEAERASLFSHQAGADGLATWAVMTEVGASVMAGGAIESLGLNNNQRQAATMMMKNVAGQDYLEDYLRYLKSVHPVQMNDELLKTL